MATTRVATDTTPAAAGSGPTSIDTTPVGTETRTADRILDVAERLVQTRGFNGFSYAHIASQLGMTKASLHYHFASKAALGSALIVRYSERFSEALRRIERELPAARDKLEAYATLYSDVLKGERMCLCGILAAEYQTLPAPMRAEVIRFFDDNEAWLAAVLDQGRMDHTLDFAGSSAETAQTILGTLEGAMLVARSYGDVSRFNSTAEHLIATLTG